MKEKLSQETILIYFNEVEKSFVPPLSESVNLIQYSKKIASKADVFCYYHESKLVSLIAVYCNNTDSKVAFITSVSSHPKYRGMGIVTLLIKEAIAYIKKMNFIEVQLEVSANNFKAYHLYTSMGFVKISTKNNIFLMRKTI